MKIKVARYKYVQFGTESVNEVKDWIENGSDYVRISEIVEVDFQSLAHDVVVAQEVASLEKSIAEIEAKAYDATANIKARIQELLALPESV